MIIPLLLCGDAGLFLCPDEYCTVAADSAASPLGIGFILYPPLARLALIHQLSGRIIPIQYLTKFYLQCLLAILQYESHLIKKFLLCCGHRSLILGHGLLPLRNPHVIAIVNRLDQPCHLHRILVQKNLPVILRPLPISFNFDQFQIRQPGKNLLHGPLTGYRPNPLSVTLYRGNNVTSIFKNRIQVIILPFCPRTHQILPNDGLDLAYPARLMNQKIIDTVSFHFYRLSRGRSHRAKKTPYNVNR